jgi:hypothetical protein
MSKIQLTIDTGYCASWGAWEGVRELVSNAKDAEDLNPRNAMEIRHSKEKSQLVLKTRDVTVDPATLLVLGRSSKRGRDVRGRFGEGFAIGCMALVRAGHPVSFRNADASWRCAFDRVEEGPLSGQELLTFYSRAITPTRDFVVTIDNVTKEVWDAMRPLFLFLMPPPPEEVVEVDQGSLILSEDRRGMIYARGVFVRRFEKLGCAYDLRDIELDRDRQMVNEWTLGTALSDLWASVLSGHKDVKQAQETLARRAYDLAKSDVDESRHFRWRTDERLVRHMKAQFEAEHGVGVVPVSTMAEAQEVTDLGATPAVVNATLRELLAKSGLSAEAAKESLEGQVQARLLPSQLTDAERAALSVVDLITREYVVVTFNGDVRQRLLDDGKVIGIDRRLLAKPAFDLLLAAAKGEGSRTARSEAAVLASALLDTEQGALARARMDEYPRADAPKAEAEQGA